MWVPRAIRLIALGASVLLLAACAETELALHAAKIFGGEEAGEGGEFKLGSPYPIDGVWYFPQYDPSYDETGVASWYGEPFHGERTANGAIYDMNALSAAHKTLPMPSRVRVTNLENGRAIVLTVNDRGPFVHGRIIDLSRRAAQLLGFEAQGTAKVRVQMLPSKEQPEVLLAALSGLDRSISGAAPESAGPLAIEPMPTGNVSVEVLTPLPVEGGLISSAAAAEPVEKVEHLSAEIQPGPLDMFIQAGAFAKHDNALKLQERLSVLAPTAISPVEVGDRILYRVRLGPFNELGFADAVLERVIDMGHTEARLIID